MKQNFILNTLMVVSALAWANSTSARPVTYTLRTVADGELGDYVFYEALVTLRLHSDTREVKAEPGPLGGMVYTNSAGHATVSITEHGRTVTAEFAPGEVYVRYDTGNGIAGFGSKHIGPFYPIALGCVNVAYPDPATYVRVDKDCLQGDWGPVVVNFYRNGTVNVLASAAYAGNPPNIAVSLAQDLSHDTLLTAVAHSCASIYTLYSPNFLDVCSAAAPRGLVTNRGGFYLQDQFGLARPFYIGQYSNSGALQVEVSRDDD